MTSPPLLMVIALLAILVGAALPVLYQLYRTLKRARTLLETVGPHLEQTLDRVGQAANRLDRIGASLEAPARTIGPLLATATGAGLSIGRSGEWLRTAVSVGGAVAPALIAGVRAFFSRSVIRRKSKDNGRSQPHFAEE